MRFLYLGIIIYSLFVNAPAYAKSTERHPQSAFSGRLLWGDCALTKDPNLTDPWPVLCLKLRGTGQVLTRSQPDLGHIGMTYSRAFAALHLNRYIAAIGEGEYYSSQIINNRDEAESEELPDVGRVKTAILQLGHPSLTRWVLAGGRQKIPYGIDFRPIPEIVHQHLKTNRYWESPIYGGTLTFDNMVDVQIDLGYGTERPFQIETQREKNARELDEEKAKRTYGAEVYSVRFMWDVSPLNGTRFYAHTLTQNRGERRVGAGFLNSPSDGGATVFEWNRLYLRENEHLFQAHQNFRLNYQGPYRNDTRTHVEFEDDAAYYRMFLIGSDFRITDYGEIALTGGYRWDITPADLDYWVFVMSLGVKI